MIAGLVGVVFGEGYILWFIVRTGIAHEGPLKAKFGRMGWAGDLLEPVFELPGVEGAVVDGVIV